MKQVLYLFILLFLVGCTDTLVENVPAIVEEKEEIYAIIEGSDSRTYLDEQGRMRWTADDRITLFKKNTYNREFKFTGKTGANAGGFSQVSTDDEFWFGLDVTANYAAYPHSTENTLDETDLFITLQMPAEQIYAENSFGLNANTMVAVSETGQLIFKNVGSYLRVRLYGEGAAISSVTVTSKGDQAIAGEAKVTPTMNGYPTCEMIGAEKSIKLICENPVSISTDAETPTDFWIVLPPVTLTDGFSVTIENSEGETQVYDVDKSFTFERNQIYNLKREVTLVTIPTNQIWYTSISGDIITPNSTTFGEAEIVSNEIQNGKGIITFDRDVIEIEPDAFMYNNDLSSVAMPNSVITLGTSAFFGCSNLNSVNIPDNVTTIGDNVFCFCTNLASALVIPDGVTRIEESTFNECNNIPSIILPENLTFIGYYAFNKCYKLESLEIPSGVTEIYEGAFASCESLKTLTLPEGITSIATSVFNGCVNLQSVNIPDGVTSIGDKAFYNCYSLTSIDIPESVNTIGMVAFLACSSLTSIIIPEGVSVLNPDLFNGCESLISVYIPSTLTYLEESIFYNCSSLEEIHCLATTPPVAEEYTFRSEVNTVKLYVPAGSLEKYQSADYWKNFVNIIEE